MPPPAPETADGGLSCDLLQIHCRCHLEVPPNLGDLHPVTLYSSAEF